jgi:hypothetical protein
MSRVLSTMKDKYCRICFSLTDIHEVFIRTQNKLMDMCPMRIVSFAVDTAFEPVLRVQVKEVLEHTFEGVLDKIDKLHIEILGNNCIHATFVE